jgi:indole-3-glycerol phosphate synthase
MNILQEIVDAKRREVSDRVTLMPIEALQREALDLAAPLSFPAVFAGDGMGIIAEVKHRSPSAGIIRDPFEPAEIARAYEAGGAGAVSVLMDEPYFGGGEAQFREVRAAVDLPLLYKEFVIDPWQVWHARSLGASALLLIAAVLSDQELKELMAEAEEAGLAVLLEVHDQAELERALKLEAPVIGINNRDLKTFHTTLETTLELAEQVPEEQVLISESGIRSREDIVKLSAAGVNGVLVGEHFLRQPDIRKAVEAMRPE